VSLADRFPRLRDRQLPQWLAEAPDDDTDLVQAARQSFADAVAYYEAESRVIDLTATNDVLLAENCRLRGELARACSERDEARAMATMWNRSP
jgi:hypothetical protein